jgi:hypothetical protein
MTHEHLTPDIFAAILAMGLRHTGTSGNTEYFACPSYELTLSHDEKGWTAVVTSAETLRTSSETKPDAIHAIKMAHLWLMSAEVGADF